MFLLSRNQGNFHFRATGNLALSRMLVNSITIPFTQTSEDTAKLFLYWVTCILAMLVKLQLQNQMRSSGQEVITILGKHCGADTQT